jgi:hypothetical protein
MNFKRHPSLIKKDILYEDSHLNNPPDLKTQAQTLARR